MPREKALPPGWRCWPGPVPGEVGKIHLFPPPSPNQRLLKKVVYSEGIQVWAHIPWWGVRRMEQSPVNQVWVPQKLWSVRKTLPGLCPVPPQFFLYKLRLCQVVFIFHRCGLFLIDVFLNKKHRPHGKSSFRVAHGPSWVRDPERRTGSLSAPSPTSPRPELQLTQP